MNKIKSVIRKLPGWAYTLLILGLLYVSGLHTEAIAQVQRVMLATGFLNPDLTEKSEIKQTYSLEPDENGAPIAEDFLLKDMNGKTVKFSSFKNKVVFLNIWATWCPPCVAEMPGIQSLYDKIKANKNIAFVMLSVDQAGAEKVQKFIAKKGFTFPMYMPAGEIPQTFQTNSIPATFIIGRDGKLATRHDGMADYDTKEMKEYLEKLAK